MPAWATTGGGGGVAMAKKNYERGLGAGDAYREYREKVKVEAEQSAGKMRLRRALPIAHFLTMGARHDIPAAERAEFNEAAATARESWDDFLQLLAKIDNECLRDSVAATVEHLCAGLAEMSRFMPPPVIVQRAVLGEDRKARARAAGQASGAKRAQEAAEMWKPHALKLALAARNTAPGISQEKVVDAIVDGWRLMVRHPSRATLRRAISAWTREGKLAAKIKS